ncbi:hypothetical protein [Microbacterium lacticum]
MEGDQTPRRASNSDARRNARARAADKFFSAPRDEAWRARYRAKDSKLAPRRLVQQKLDQKKAASERARAWNKAHAEQVRETQRRWREANADRVRAYGRASYAHRREQVAERGKADRDRNPEKYRQRHREWLSRNPGYSTEYGRKYRQDPDRYARMLESNRNAKRLAKRLATLGLPPRRITRSTAADRRANERAAVEFFTSDESRERQVEYNVFHTALAAAVADDGAKLWAEVREKERRRSVQGLPPVDPDEQFFAQAVDAVLEQHGDFALTSTDVRRAITSVREVEARRLRDDQQRTLQRELVAYVRSNVSRLSREAQMENRALVIAGKSEQPIGLVAHRIAVEKIRERLSLDRLPAPVIEKTILAVHERHPALFDPPHKVGSEEQGSAAVRASFPTPPTSRRASPINAAGRVPRQSGAQSEVER